VLEKKNLIISIYLVQFGTYIVWTCMITVCIILEETEYIVINQIFAILEELTNIYGIILTIWQISIASLKQGVSHLK